MMETEIISLHFISLHSHFPSEHTHEDNILTSKTGQLAPHHPQTQAWKGCTDASPQATHPCTPHL